MSEADFDKLFRRYTNLPIVIDMLLKRRLTVAGFDSWDDYNDRFSMGLYKKSIGKEAFVGAYCLTTSKIQTFHHWKIFADGSSGVCVVFDAERFGDFLSNLDRNCYRNGEVKYVGFRTSKRLLDYRLNNAFEAVSKENIPFIKRSSFQSEQEYRIVCCIEDEHEPVHHIEFDPSIISSIVLSPFMPVGLRDSVKRALKSIDGCPKSVVQAKLTDSSQWQQGIERYARRCPEVANA